MAAIVGQQREKLTSGKGCSRMATTATYPVIKEPSRIISNLVYKMFHLDYYSLFITP